jgi:hypothetical protein
MSTSGIKTGTETQERLKQENCKRDENKKPREIP